MKKNIILFSTLSALLLFSGCTQQVASPNPNDATMVANNTVTLDSSAAGVNGYSDSSISSDNANGNGKNSVHFAYDSNKLNSAERAKISKDTNILQNRSQIKVEGNSDEFGTDEYNYALGLRRAKAVKDDMVAKGIDPDKIKVVSYGESNPNCEDKTKACYQKNRRADYQ